MADTLPFTGVTLTAAGLSDYLTSLSRAESATTNYERAVATLTATINKSSLDDAEKQKRIQALTAGLNEVTIATEKYNLAIQSGNFVVMKVSAEELAAVIKDLNVQLALYAKTLESTSTGQRGFMTEARGGRMAGLELIFALQLLSTSMGEQLPQAAQQAQKGLQLVVTGMLAGAYVGGPFGAAIGTITGVLLALGVASQTTDANIAAFNKQIDTLAKHDDAAAGLAKLAGVSQDDAQAVMDLASKVPAVADELAKLRDETGTNAVPVLQGLGDIFRDLTDIIKRFSDEMPKAQTDFKNLLTILVAFNPYLEGAVHAFDNLSNAVKLAQANVAAFNALATAIAAGKGPIDALAAAHVAFRNALDNVNPAIKQTNQYVEEHAQLLKQLEATGLSTKQIDDYVNAVTRGVNDASASIRALQALLARQGREGFVEAPARNDAEVAREAFAKFQLAVSDSESKLTEEEVAATEERNARLNEITTRGKEEQARIIREYNQRIASIDSQFAQDVSDATADYQQRLQDINDNAAQQRQQRDQQYADRRQQILQQYADRREQIEQQYQDRVRQIQEQYALSFFEAESRRDAKAIIQARMARDKGLQDAAQTRDRENKSAADTRDRDLEAVRKAQERAQKDEAAALERQRQQAQQAYERRLRDLQQAADKQRASAAQNEKDQLSDLATNLAQQRAAENASYAAQIARARQANRDRIATLVQGLSQQKDLTDEWAVKIIQSLSKILSPQQISDLIKQYKDALNIRFSVDISTINKGPTQTGSGPTKGSAQAGSYVPATGSMLVHAGETVVNPDYPGRALDLLSRYVMPRLNLPLAGAGLGAGTTRVQLSGDIKLNDPMLNGRILILVDGHVAQVINSVSGSLS